MSPLCVHLDQTRTPRNTLLHNLIISRHTFRLTTYRDCEFIQLKSKVTSLGYVKVNYVFPCWKHLYFSGLHLLLERHLEKESVCPNSRVGKSAACCLSPSARFDASLGCVRKFQVTWGLAIVLAGYHGSHHHSQSASYCSILLEMGR